jgi:sulfur-oxidizing protein SoxB
VRWGPSLLPGQDITREDIWNVTSMTYPKAYRTEMTGERIKVVLEDVADNIFNPDPYYQQGGDMVRVGGMGYRIDVNKPQGERISDMTLLKTARPIDPERPTSSPAGPASTKAPKARQIWDVVESHIRKLGTVMVVRTQQQRRSRRRLNGHEKGEPKNMMRRQEMTGKDVPNSPPPS